MTAATYLTNGHRSYQTDMAKGFTAVDIGKMDLHAGEAHRRQSISNGNAGMGIGRRVDHYSAALIPTILNRSDQFPFTIGLKKNDLTGQLGGELGQVTINISEGQTAVDARFTGTEKIQIRSMEYQKFHNYESSRSSSYVFSLSRYRPRPMAPSRFMIKMENKLSVMVFIKTALLPEVTVTSSNSPR